MITFAEYSGLSLTLLATRAMDLLSTYHATPRFDLEMNRWMKRVGWRNTIMLNAVVVLVAPLLVGKHPCVMIATFSALLAWRNYQLMPLINMVGEKRASELLANYFRDTSGRRFWPAVLIKLLTFMSIGIAVLGVKAVDHQNRLWFIADVASALVFFANFIAVSEILARIAARRKPQTEPQSIEGAS